MTDDTSNADWLRETADALRQVADTLTSMRPAQMRRTGLGTPNAPNLRISFADRAPLDELSKQEGWQFATVDFEHMVSIKVGPLYVWATAPKNMVATCEHCGATHNCVHAGGEVQA